MQDSIGTITGIHPRSKYGRVKINRHNLVDAFQEKPSLSDWVNGGYMIFDKRVFEYIKSGEMEHIALKRLARIKELSLYKHDGFWFSVDTNKELEDLNQMWESGDAPWKIWK